MWSLSSVIIKSTNWKQPLSILQTRNNLLFALKLDKCNCIDNKQIALCKSSGGNSELLRFSGSRQSVFEVCLVCSRSMLPSSLHSIARHCRLTQWEKTLEFRSEKSCVSKRQTLEGKIQGFNIHYPFWGILASKTQWLLQVLVWLYSMPLVHSWSSRTVWTTVGIDCPNSNPTKICNLHSSEAIAAIVHKPEMQLILVYTYLFTWLGTTRR